MTLVGHSLHFLALVAIGEHGLQLGLPCFLEVCQVGGFARYGERVLGGDGAHHLSACGNFGPFRQLQHKGAVGQLEQVVRGNAVKGNAQAVAHAHLEQGFGQSAVSRGGNGQHLLVLDGGLKGGEHLQQGVDLGGQAVLLVSGGEQRYAAAGLLELGGGHGVHGAHGSGKANQRGRNVQVVEAAGHGVLAADGANAQVDLGHQGAQQGAGGHAPALGDVAQLAEVLLEGQVHGFAGKAGGGQLGNGFHHSQVGAGELVLFGKVGIEAPGHTGAGGGFAVDGHLGHHGQAGGELLGSAEGHEHGGSADSGVKALGQALVGGHVQVGDQGVHALCQGCARPFGRKGLGGLDVHPGALGGAVGVQERAGDVDDVVAVPVHDQARLLGDGGDDRCLQVFLLGVAQELLHILGGHGAGHALLGFGDCQLGAVQAFILLGHGIQVDVEAVGDFARCNGNAACAEVVAALDQLAGVATAEQALELALHGGVALLDLGAAGFDGAGGMGFGAAGCAADAVATGAAAQQDDGVTGSGGFATHVPGRGGCHHGADFHALGSVAGVVQLVDLAGCQADLVAVAGVAGGCGLNQLALGQLSGNGFAHGLQRVGSAGDAHCLVHVGAAGQRVADGAAHAGRCAAEGLHFRGVVVGFVLEQVQPVLLFAVHVHLYLDGAGVDFLGFVQVAQDALGLQVLGADGSHVHQADGLFVPAQLMTHLQVAVEGGLDHGVVDLHVGQHGAEGGVAAVVGPVGVYHLDLGDGGTALLFFAEVLLEEGDVGQVHGQTALIDEGLQAVGVKVQEAVQDFHRRRRHELHLQGFGQLKAGFPSFDGVDHVALDGLHVLRGKGTFQEVDLGGADLGTLALADQLHAFAGGVSALVELAGQVLHGEHGGAVGVGHFGGCVVGLGLAEHGGDACFEELVADALHVVAVDESQVFQLVHAKDVAQLACKLLCLDVEAGFLLYVDARNHGSCLPAFSFAGTLGAWSREYTHAYTIGDLRGGTGRRIGGFGRWRGLWRRAGLSGGDASRCPRLGFTYDWG